MSKMTISIIFQTTWTQNRSPTTKVDQIMMTISTKGRYACRIMVLLAARVSAGPVTKYEIAEAEAISPDYVQQIMMRLKAAGLVRSHRGRGGGFSVAKDPKLISISDVLVAMEGRVAPAPCGEPECCDRADMSHPRRLDEGHAALGRAVRGHHYRRACWTVSARRITLVVGSSSETLALAHGL